MVGVGLIQRLENVDRVFCLDASNRFKVSFDLLLDRNLLNAE
jgi:hypothetical protein